ncbi:hypothetical protein HNP33_003696 [Comamonas odontotermitis]|uniref:Minor tail protein n=1 Tax=Comamonas odontotermitis TaxID=379895 RepID=A0ABR6RK95_9BURK|nr:hypothetical protein [Comamonas odontotermitis]MBB6579582.1 hypothetical protein [Comamonas odontotermitis]
MTGLKTISPLDITDSVIVSQPPVEDAAVAWTAGSWPKGSRVRYQHIVYQAGSDVNNAIPPPDNQAVWIPVGPTNTWALFNGRTSQSSKFNATASYRFKFGRAVDAVAAIGLVDVQTIRVRVIDPTYGTVFDKSLTVGLAPEIPDWWEWHFGVWTPTGALGMFTGLPAYPQADVLVDFTGTTQMEVGNLIMGNSKEWGLGVEVGASVGIQDFSRKDLDEYGNRVLVERTYIGWADMSVPVRRAEITPLKSYMAQNRAKPILFIGSQDIEALNVFGIAKDWSIAIEYYGYAMFAIQLEEV